MELLLNIIKVFWSMIKIILSNPILLTMFVLSIMLEILYPKLRGLVGELKVKLKLKQLHEKEYIVLNDIMLEDENGTHQIDHLVISKYGIFVIEMKNYYGLIIGDEYKNNWTQYLGKKKSDFKNPIHQNYGHTKALEKILNIDNKIFIPTVCFSNQVELKTNTKSIVIQLKNLIKTIKSFYLIQLDMDIKEIENQIQSVNITDKSERKKHIKNIKIKIKEENIKVDNMICPKCGNKLVLRNGKYGTFIGCSNFPKCQYTNNRR